MYGKGPQVGVWCTVEDGNRILTFVNELQHPDTGKYRAGRIISLLALPLHINEPTPEGSDFRRESAHCGLSIALVPGMSMFQRPIGLAPCRLISIGSRGASQPVCAALGKGVKQGIVGSANGAA